MTKFNPRKKKLIDWDVQGTLLFRAAYYWVLCVLVTGLALLGWQVLVGPSGSFFSHFRLDLLWIDYRAALIASLFTLPLILIDVVRVSNRFSGPVYRLRRSLRSLANGETVDLVRFRPGDFWQDMADDFNAVAIYVEKLKRQAEANPSKARPATDENFQPTIAK